MIAALALVLAAGRCRNRHTSQAHRLGRDSAPRSASADIKTG
jgi:hypothetical protein